MQEVFMSITPDMLPNKIYKPKEGSSTNPGKQSVAFSATVLWDNIPVDLKT